MAINDEKILLQIAKELLSNNFDQTKLNAFLEDVLKDTENDKALGYTDNLKNLNPAVIEAWGVVNEAISHPKYGSQDTDYRRDFEALKAVDKLLTAKKSIILYSPQKSRKTNIQNMLTFATSNKNFNGYQSVGVPCNTCQSKSTDFDALHKILSDVDALSVYSGMTSGKNVNFNRQTLTQQGVWSAAASLYDNVNWDYFGFMGFAFITRVVAQPAAHNIVKGFEVKFSGKSGSNRRGDVLCSLPRLDKMIDGKSWTPITLQSNFKVGADKYAQFLDYIGLINSLNQLEYWFDGRKMDPSTIKTTLKGIWLANGILTAEGTALFDAIWANNTPSITEPNGLRGSLFDLSATATKTPKQQFVDIISDLNNHFYEFIKVK